MLKIIFTLSAFYFGMVVLLYLVQRQLVYFPEQNAPTPAEAGVPEMQVVTLQTDDNLRLKAWYRAPTERGKPTLVYFHGNAGHIGYRGFIVSPYLRKGYGVLLLTYRGYSGNPGTPTEEGLYADARAAIDFVENQGVPESCIVVYGNSIGAAVAIQMATEHQVGAVILQSPFTSLSKLGQYHYPYLPVRWLTKDRYNSIGKVDAIQSPVLILHGKNDSITPFHFGQKLFDALPEPKEAYFISQGRHNDLFEPERVTKFIEKHLHCE